MTLKELKEAFCNDTPLNFGGDKANILSIVQTDIAGETYLKSVNLFMKGADYHFEDVNIFDAVTPWEEPTNKGENVKTKEQKTLELIKAALAGETILWVDGKVTNFRGLDLISLIMENPSSYSIKPKTKTVNYQTRLYETTEGNFRIWNSLYGYSQKSTENFLEFKGWLEPVQEHVFEYEVE